MDSVHVCPVDTDWLIQRMHAVLQEKGVAGDEGLEVLNVVAQLAILEQLRDFRLLFQRFEPLLARYEQAMAANSRLGAFRAMKGAKPNG